MATEILDTLNRKDEASTLLKLLKSEHKRRVDTDESLVISLAAPWGYGKTTFLELLKQEAQNEHFVFYFDAWTNDHSDDALTSFLAEFNSSLTAFAKDHEPQAVAGIENTGKSIIRGSKAVVRAAAPLVAGHFMKRAVGFSVKELLDVYKDQDTGNDEDGELAASHSADEEAAATISSTVATNLAKDALKTHDQAKAAKEALADALDSLNSAIDGIEGYSTPIIILIDELDRCRPNYAIQLLEAMKHFFNSKGVVYIVANNADELGHSIKALYGSGFDSAGYLKRFFDFQYRLKDPDTRLFCEGISREYELNEGGRFFTPLDNRHESLVSSEGISDDIVAWHLELVIKAFQLSLRDAKQVALRLNSISVLADRNLDMFVLLFMLSADHKRSGSHRRMMIEGQNKWRVEDFDFIVDLEFVDRTLNKNTNNRTTSISSIFGFYANAETYIKKNRSFASENNMTFLNRRVLMLVHSRLNSEMSVSEEYFALVEQLSNLTM